MADNLKFHLTGQELFDLLCNHFKLPGGGHWVMHLDVPATDAGYTIDVEFERYDPRQHASLRNAPKPLLRVVKGGCDEE